MRARAQTQSGQLTYSRSLLPEISVLRDSRPSWRARRLHKSRNTRHKGAPHDTMGMPDALINRPTTSVTITFWRSTIWLAYAISAGDTFLCCASVKPAAVGRSRSIEHPADPIRFDSIQFEPSRSLVWLVKLARPPNESAPPNSPQLPVKSQLRFRFRLAHIAHLCPSHRSRALSVGASSGWLCR